MGSRSSRSTERRRRVGVFLGGVDDSYQRRMWASMSSRAAELGLGLIGVFGHGLGSPVPAESTMNVAYRMMGSSSIDALVVLSNTVGNFEDPRAVARLVESVGVPAVSISFDLPGFRRVYAPGGRPMEELVHHLVREHGRRSFALVTGPRRHVDSVEREAAFRAALAAEGLAFDERLLYEGAFYKESGREAVRRFLAASLSFDALVCLNDYMALGALAELKARGLSVPYDLSLTGFDDVEEASCCDPPLTTVRQPIAELGRVAIELACEAFDSREPISKALPCELILRRSCGCPPSLAIEGEAAPPRASKEEEAELVSSIASLAAAGRTDALLEAFDRELTRLPDESASFSSLRRLLDRARRLEAEGRAAGAEGSAPLPSPASGSFGRTLLYLGEVERRREMARGGEAAERAAFIGKLGSSLLGTFRLDALVDEWDRCLERLGLAAGHLVLFEGSAVRGGAEAPPRASLVYRDKGKSIKRLYFPTRLVLPPSLPEGAGWVIEPLVYQDEALGYLLIDCSSDSPSAYEMLRVYMSTAVKATLLMEETAAHKRELEEKVRSRTRELREANRDLREQIEERRRLEREVQDISNRTMQSIGQDLHDDLCQHLAGISMLAAVAEGRLESSGSVPADSLRRIHSLLDSAIERTRQYARTLYPPALESEGFVAAIQDLVEAQKRAGCEISLSFQDEAEPLSLRPGEALCLYRIAQEALSNALRHSGSEAVVIRLLRREGLVVLEVRDFGCGLEDGEARNGAREGPRRAKGIGMRIMRYRAESAGARLEIKNLEPGLCVSCSLEPQGEEKR